MINIAELLKDAPKDLKLYSPICGHCKLSCILYDDGIRVIAHDVPFRFDKYGRFCSADDAECLLFPSKDCRTWEGWKPPVEPKFKVGDEIAWIEAKGSKPTEPVKIIRLIDKDQLYMVDTPNGVSHVAYDMQDYYKLVQKPHYDIKNFYAGMPVLVRDSNKHKWKYVVFSHNEDKSSWGYKFNAAGTVWLQCIPYNDYTKHLLGTTDMCDEQYINW